MHMAFSLPLTYGEYFDKVETIVPNGNGNVMNLLYNRGYGNGEGDINMADKVDHEGDAYMEEFIERHSGGQS